MEGNCLMTRTPSYNSRNTDTNVAKRDTINISNNGFPNIIEYRIYQDLSAVRIEFFNGVNVKGLYKL